MFFISERQLEELSLKDRIVNEEAGAFVLFEGWVRDNNEGRSVISLEYEAFEELAQTEAEKILDEAKSQFDILDAVCVHRVGKLKIGDMAVWVGVTSAHRTDAFKACRYIIDQIKHRLPVWKKEFYSEGDSGWVNCQDTTSQSVVSGKELNEDDYYSRQTSLADIGRAGQEKLKYSKVLVIGAGGLGSPALLYLASAGVGMLGICEFDQLEVSNLHRQILYDAEDVGMSKVVLAAKRIRQLNPFIEVRTYSDRAQSKNIESLFRQYDLVLDCTDNFTTKFLLNDAAVLTGTPLIQSSIYQYEGQIHLYVPSSPDSSCLRCLWPEVPEPGCVGTCAEVGVLGVVPGVFGTLQAMEALKFILKLPGALSPDIMLVIDLLSYSIQKIRRPKNQSCPFCSNRQGDWNLTDSEEEDRVWEVEISTLDFNRFRELKIIDIRESHEKGMTSSLKLENSLEIPGSSFSPDNPLLNGEKEYLLLCTKGLRSSYLAKTLHQRGFSNFYSISGGIPALEVYLRQNLQVSGRQ